MAWLVTGGAGYIGSHVVRALLADGLEVVVLDDLSSGHREFVPAGVPLVEASVLEASVLDELFAARPIDGVIHLAAYKYAGESVKRPLHTYEQNVLGTMTLLAAMERAGVGRIVFSSSAGVYGTPRDEYVTESTPTTPESPYGESKLIGEWMLRDQGVATGLVHTALRYFNVVGSGAPELRDTSPYNLFPVVFRALSAGQRPKLFGDDYPTPDGSCVRDYVHVADIAQAHVAAARRMLAGEPLAPVYNLGSGSGSSVHEIMRAMARGTGIAFEPEIAPRRPGDPARTVADGSLAARDLGWRMTRDLDDMVATAWRAWTASLPDAEDPS